VKSKSKERNKEQQELPKFFGSRDQGIFRGPGHVCMGGHGQSHCGVGHSQGHGGLDGQGHVGIVGQDRLCNRPAAQVIQSCTTAPAKPSVAMDPAMQSDPAMRQCTARAIPGQVSMYERGHQGNRRQRPCDDVRQGPSPAKRQYMASTVQRKTASALKRDLPMGESTLS